MDRKARRFVWVLGLAGLGRNVGWGMNKVFTAVLLGSLTSSTQLIGTVLGMEGLFGLILNPLTGWLSDRYATRVGRRRPYLFIAFPGAAIMLILMYFTRSLGLAIGATLLFYFFQQLSPTPYQAMMPDSVQEGSYGEASGILNLLWLLGNLIAFLVVPLVYELVSHTLGFVLGAGILLIGGLWTAIASREAPPRAREARASLRPLLSASLLKYYVAQGLWWLGFEAIASFFTLYMVHALHGSVLDSALGMSIFTVAGMLVAIWFGRIYRRRDSRTVLALTLTLFAIVSLTGLWLQNVLSAFLLLAVAGFAWGGIQVISYPLAADLLLTELLRSGLDLEAAQPRALQLHGALYGGANLVQALGLLVAAPLAGWVIALQQGHYQAMFLVSFASLLLSLLIVLSFAPARGALPVDTSAM